MPGRNELTAQFQDDRIETMGFFINWKGKVQSNTVTIAK